MARPIGIDLFAGAGGMSLGFEMAGFDVAVAVEIDPIHCATHQYNFPLCQVVCADINQVEGSYLRKEARLGDKDIEVVFGGSPCQGFSLIGKRCLQDPRNHLAMQFVRLVQELNPKYFVFENVKGLAIGTQRLFLQQIIGAFEEIGYHVVTPWKVLNAALYGVPQNRERLFLLGSRKDQPLPAYPEPMLSKVTVRDAISDLPNIDDFPELLDQDAVRVKWSTESRYARILRGLEEDKDDLSYFRHFDRDLLTSSMRTMHTVLSTRRFEATPNGSTEPVSRFRKLALDGICNTLRAGTDSSRGAFTSARPIHPVWPRVITVREGARLHSFPDWFRFHVTKWHGFRQLGNSVPPYLARAVAAMIIRSLGFVPKKPEKTLELGDKWLLSLDMKTATEMYKVDFNVIPHRLKNKKEKIEYAVQ